MPLPPNTGSDRWLRRAVIMMRAVTVLHLCLVGILMTQLIVELMRYPTALFSDLIILSIMTSPAVLCLILAAQLARYRFWALIASLCLASIAAILTSYLSIVLFSDILSFMRDDDHLPTILFVMAGFLPLISAALGVTVFFLIKSFKAVNESRARETGFEPVLASPINVEQR
jgi:hypothetical protein